MKKFGWQGGVITASAIAALCNFDAHAQCTLIEDDRLFASDAEANDRFGTSVTVSGNFAIIGAEQGDATVDDTGAAYVFQFQSGAWSELQKLPLSTSPPIGAGSDFGFSVDIDGDVAIVGAPQANGAATTGGFASVYRFDSTEWELEANLIPSSGAQTDDVGFSVAIEDDVAVVGVPGRNGDVGSVLVYRDNGTSWALEAELEETSSTQTFLDRFGVSVDISGDYIMVGVLNAANFESTAAAQFFHWDGTEWDFVDEIMVASNAPGDPFEGVNVAIDGDVAVLGARYGVSASVTTGVVCVARLDGSDWEEEQTLVGSDVVSGDQFGSDVAVSGDIIAVGARAYGQNPDRGGVLVFEFDGTDWEEILQSSDSLQDPPFGGLDNAGAAVAVDGETLFAGIPRNDEMGSDSGAATVYILTDCNENGIPDDCEDDCNENGVPDDCDIEDQTSQDCNENEIPDECETDCNGNGIHDDCDIASGTSDDCDLDGIPDECEALVQSMSGTMAIVIVFDTSGSQQGTPASGGEGDLCDRVDDLTTELEAALPAGISLELTVWGISDLGQGFTCLSSTVTDEICELASPPPSCNPPFQPGVSDWEDWGRASAAVAEAFDWPDTNFRIIIPFSDEGPEDGEPCATPFDASAIEIAIDALTAADVVAFPILGREPVMAEEECITSFMDELADATGGQRLDSESETLVDELVDEILNYLIENYIVDCDDDGTPDGCENDCDCDGVPDDCDTEPDNDENGIPDNCDLCSGCAPDLNDDGMIGFADLLLLLDAWGTSDEDADLDESGTVGFQDLLILLDAWGPCEEIRACPCEPLSLEEALEAVCLDEDDFDDYVNVLDSGTQQDKDRYECWFEAYLNGGGSCDPPNSCPTPDPFAD